MIPENGVSTHPGEVLREEFLIPLGISQTVLADELGVSIQRVNKIVNERRGVSADTAWLFADAFGTTPEFWMNLQAMYDLTSNRPRRRHGLAKSILRRSRPRP